jgi:hypothetical protein
MMGDWRCMGRIARLDAAASQDRNGTTRDTRGESVSSCCKRRGEAGRDDEGKDGIREHTNGDYARKVARWQEMAALEECKVPR